MADFSQFRAGGPTGSAATAQQGVVDTSQVEVLSLINNAARSILPGMKANAAAGRKAKQEEKVDTAKRDVTNQFLEIADAQAMGEIDQRTAQARSRRLYSQSLSSGLVPSDDLRTIAGDFIDVGADIKKGTEEEQAAAKLKQAATGDGWIKPGMTQKEQTTAISNYQDFKLASKKLSDTQARVDLSEQQKGIKQRSALAEMSPAYTQKVKGDIQNTLSALAAGKIPNEQAVNELNTQWATIQATIGSQGDSAGATFMSNLTTPMKTMYDNALKVASGEQSKDIYQNVAARNVAMAQANITGDPKVASLIAFTKSFQNSDLILQKQITDQAVLFLGRYNNPEQSPPDPTDPSNKEDVAFSLGIVKENAGKLLKGTAIDPKDTQVEVSNGISQAIKSVGMYGSNVDKPEQLNDVMSFIADPVIGNTIVKAGGVPADVAEQAKVMFNQAYKQPAVQAVLTAFDSGKIEGARSTALGFGPISSDPVATSIFPVFSGNGVVFTMDGNVSGVSQRAVMAKVKDLNKNAAPILNRLIRADAHLNLSTDYAKTYREHYEQLFMPKEVPAEKPAGLSSDELSAEPASKEKPAEGRAVSSEMSDMIKGLKESGNSKADVLKTLNWLGFKDNRGTGVDMFKAVEEAYGDSE